MKDLTIFGFSIPAMYYVPVFYFIWVTVLFLMKRVFFAHVHRFAMNTKTKLDDVFIKAADLPLTLIIFVSGAFVLDNIFQFKMDTEILQLIDIVFKATAIIALIIFVDKLFKGFLEHYADSNELLKHSGGVIHVAIRVVVMGLGLLIVLDSCGVAITPILASLGVGSLAVALALQPTLENFFSGVQIMADRPIKVGQFIKLESGEEGYVEKIGWRSTWVRMLPNNVVVVPNKILVSSTIRNYYYPETEMSVYVQVGVHYDSDLEHVEKVAIGVATEVLTELEGGVSDFAPFIRYHTFNDSSIDFTVILRGKEFMDKYLIKHEFIKRLHKKFKEEGITIPYPIRTMDWNPGSDPLKIER